MDPTRASPFRPAATISALHHQVGRTKLDKENPVSQGASTHEIAELTEHYWSIAVWTGSGCAARTGSSGRSAFPSSPPTSTGSARSCAGANASECGWSAKRCGTSASGWSRIARGCAGTANRCTSAPVPMTPRRLSGASLGAEPASFPLTTAVRKTPGKPSVSESRCLFC